MTTSVIIILCVLLIAAYIFDITASKTKIPSVILLLLVGWLVKNATTALAFTIPDLTPLLPLLGTVGLILIVLEGSLELEFNKSKLPFIRKSALLATISMFAFSFLLAYMFHYVGNISFKDGLANAIPLGIISSAIAIPSAQNLNANDKEFITYESSLSDIIGVIFFNFITLNDNIGTQSIGIFVLQLILILVVTIVATMALAFLLSKIKNHIKFTPIILMIILIYAISKTYHLPALIFILLFGIFLGNLDEFKNLTFVKKLQPNILNKEVRKFKGLTTEITFLVRALFFLLFGYLIETSELLNVKTFSWSLSICAAIFLIRLILLKAFKLHLKPLFYIAPRGLITILLFISIPVSQATSLANKSLIIQVIILTALIMMLGLMTTSKEKIENISE